MKAFCTGRRSSGRPYDCGSQGDADQGITTMPPERLDDLIRVDSGVRSELRDHASHGQDVGFGLRRAALDDAGLSAF
jgi:hypothetical protein